MFDMFSLKCNIHRLRDLCHKPSNLVTILQHIFNVEQIHPEHLVCGYDYEGRFSIHVPLSCLIYTDDLNIPQIVTRQAVVRQKYVYNREQIEVEILNSTAKVLIPGMDTNEFLCLMDGNFDMRSFGRLLSGDHVDYPCFDSDVYTYNKHEFQKVQVKILKQI